MAGEAKLPVFGERALQPRLTVSQSKRILLLQALGLINSESAAYVRLVVDKEIEDKAKANGLTVLTMDRMIELIQSGQVSSVGEALEQAELPRKKGD